MSASQKAAKPASRWGFLSQAVASVESHLDTILADEETGAKKTTTPGQGAASVPPKQVPPESGRNSPNVATNDRLQERLARAMAKKAASRTESPASTTEPVPRNTTSFDLGSRQRPSIDSQTEEVVPQLENGIVQTPSIDDQEQLALPATTVTESDAVENTGTQLASLGEGKDVDDAMREADVSTPTDNTVRDTPKSSLEVKPQVLENGIRQVTTEVPISLESIESAALLSLQLEHEAAQAKIQEELNIYVEKFDALQAKLQYLTKELAESAKQSAAIAPAGSLDRKLHEHEERIALLMEEGQALSKTEIRHLGTIKKLRAQTQTLTKDQEASKTRAEKVERTLSQMEERAKRAEASHRRAEQSLSAASTTANEFEALKRERNALNATLADMRAQLVRANTRAEAAEVKAQSEQLEVERRKAVELQDDLTSARLEREIAEEKLKREIKDLQSSLEREKEHSRMMETEMLGEQAALESRLESFRARAEEASSSDHGAAHITLLRQVETLQSQYAAASQNWQGIEGTMLARVTDLEMQRNEVVERESDLRKKLREATLKAKHAERELDAVQNKSADLEKSHVDAQKELERAQKKIRQLGTETSKLRSDLESQRGQFDRELTRRIDEEKSKWAVSLHANRLESPAPSVRKGSTFGVDPMIHFLGATHPDRSGSRRPSVISPNARAPPRLQSTTSLQGLANGGVAETPSIVTSPDPDEYFPSVSPTPISASHAPSRGVNELVSTSTIGAGPSVQLVERMSANVRRLESEKAASKDELARIMAQRDEARQEVVNLMREVEQKRKADQDLQLLRKEHDDLDQRHQTTLELLGEKSEQVEELRADVMDLKEMYRELADTMK